jgi:hypothetical protein
MSDGLFLWQKSLELEFVDVAAKIACQAALYWNSGIARSEFYRGQRLTLSTGRAFDDAAS